MKIHYGVSEGIYAIDGAVWYVKLCAKLKTHWSQFTTRDWKRVRCLKCLDLKYTVREPKE